MRGQLPLHLQVLVALRTKVQERQQTLEARTGKGLPDQEYQRHVGRIAECEQQLTQIAEFMKSGLEEVEDQEGMDHDERQTARRIARRPRQTQ